MRVLWFTLTPCNASEILNSNQLGCGWLTSLEQALTQQEVIQLHICFYSNIKVKTFSHNKTVYYPIYRNRSSSKIGRYLTRLSNILSSDKNEIPLLIDVINKVKPDVIHIHGTEENFGLIQNFTEIPTIISMQGILSPYCEKFFSGIPSAVANKYERYRLQMLKLSAWSYFKNMTARAYREREMLKKAKYVIGRTNWDFRVAKILALKATYFTNNEILRESFYKIQWKKNKFENKIRIITVSKNNFYKGLETIIKASSILLTYPGFEFEWLVVGFHPEDSVVSVVKKWLGINFSSLPVKFLGKKNETEIAELLLSADIYCQVSHIENSPNSLCEAMLIGLPIVATSVGGTSSLLKDSVEGLLVQDGEPYALSGAIIDIAQNFSRSANYAKAAAKKAKERHSKDTIVSDLISIYKTII